MAIQDVSKQNQQMMRIHQLLSRLASGDIETSSESGDNDSLYNDILTSIHTIAERLRKAASNQAVTASGKVNSDGDADSDYLNERLENAQQAGSNLLNTIFAVSPYYMVVLDRELVYRKVTLSFSQMVGIPAENLIGKTDFDVFPADVAEAYRQSDLAVINSGEQAVIIREVAQTDASTKWLEVTKTPYWNEKGEILGILISAHDITGLKREEWALNRDKQYFAGVAEKNWEELVKTSSRLRKQAIRNIDMETALQDSERRLRHIYDQNPSMYFTVAVDGTIQSVNHFGASQLGYSIDDLVGTNVMDIFHEDDRETVPAQVQRCLDNMGEILTWQLRKRKRDGTIIWVEEVARAAVERDGSTSIFIVCNDISVRKNTEDKYNLLFERAPVMTILTYNQNGAPLITRCNELFCKRLGYTKDEILGKPLTKFYTDKSTRLLLDNGGYRKALCDEFVPEERELVARDRSVVPTILHSMPELDRQGSVIGTKAMFIDISEERRSRERVAQLQTFYRFILDALPIGIVVFGPEDRYHYLNPATDPDSNTRTWLLGKDDLDYCEMQSFPEEIGRRRIERLREARESGTTVTFEEELPATSSTDTRYFSRTLCPIMNADGAVTQIIGYSIELTEEKKLESQVRHTQKLEGIGVLAAGVAHDFNNILTGIMGNVSLAKIVQAKGSTIGQHLDEIERITQQAANLCRQLMDYAGKGTPAATRKLDLSNEIRQLSGLFSVSVPKSIDCRYELADDLPLVEADPSQLQQVFMNLITNAAEAVDEHDGALRIRTSLFPAAKLSRFHNYLRTELPPQTYISVKVADDGCGMNLRTQSKIFDPFFSTKTTGRGLGLASVLGIVRSHRGGISIKSEPGKGTTVEIILPVSKED